MGWRCSPAVAVVAGGELEDAVVADGELAPAPMMFSFQPFGTFGTQSFPYLANS